MAKKKQLPAANAAVANTDRKEEFLLTLQSCLGLQTLALTKTGVTKEEYFQWLEEDEAFNLKVLETKEYVGDFVEQKLFKKIQEGELEAIIFYCKTKLRDRGYFEKK